MANFIDQQFAGLDDDFAEVFGESAIYTSGGVDYEVSIHVLNNLSRPDYGDTERQRHTILTCNMPISALAFTPTDGDVITFDEQRYTVQECTLQGNIYTIVATRVTSQRRHANDYQQRPQR